MSSNSQPSSTQQSRNVLASWGAFALSALAGLFLSPFVVARLGSEAYGLWTVVGSLTSSLGILDLGMRSAVVRFVSRHHARADHAAASETAGHLQVLYTLAAMVAVAAGLVLAYAMPAIFDVPARLVREGRTALLLAVLSLAVNLVGSVTIGVLMAVDRLDIVGFGDVSYEACRIAGVLLVLGSGGGIAQLASVGLVLSVCRLLALRVAMHRVYPELRPAWRWPERTSLTAIVDVSFFSTVIYASATLASQAGTLIIGATLPLTLAAYYAVGGTLPEYALALNRPIAQTVHPRASRLDALGDADGLRSLILATGRFSALVLLPVILTFLVRGKTFIGIWQGAEFREPAGTVLGIIAIGTLFAGPRHVIQAAFVGSGRHRVLGLWYVGEALVRILATFLLVRVLGLTGAAWAAIAPSALMALGVLPRLCRQHFGIPAGVLLRTIWLRPLLAMIPFALALLAVDLTLPASTYVTFFAQVALLLPVALGGALLLGLDRNERGGLLAALSKRYESLFSRWTH